MGGFKWPNREPFFPDFPWFLPCLKVSIMRRCAVAERGSFPPADGAAEQGVLHLEWEAWSDQMGSKEYQCK